jgi:cytochrome c-type biogenesis protein CcmH/NrfG
MMQPMELRRPALVEALDGHVPPILAVPQEERPIVVVVGMHRSGTSLCSHILSMLGVDMTDDIDVQPSNARGQWERLELRDFHDRILELFDRGFYRPNHDLPLPAAWWAEPRVHVVREDIVAFLRRRLPARRLFGFKDPRTARLLPLWHQIFDALQLRPRFVLCLRNPAQVARSLAARDGFSPQRGECRWFCYMAEALANLRDCEQLCTIEYEDWFVDPAVNLEKLTAFLGLPAERAPAELRLAVSQIVDPYLRHDATGPAAVHQPLVRSLYEVARNFAQAGPARDSLGRIAEEFGAFRELYRPVHDELERLSRLAAKLPEYERMAIERGAEITALRNSLGECEAALARGEQVSDERDTALAEAELRHTDLAERLARAEERAVEHAAKAAAAEAALERVENERAFLREELDRALQTAAQFEDIADAAQAAIDTLRARLARAEEEMAESLAEAESEREALCEERDRLAQECDEIREERGRLTAEETAWFDAAVLAAMERIIGGRPTRGWRIGRYRLHLSPIRGTGSPMQRADRARDARQWERAARFYLEALEQRAPNRPAIWVQLGHALKEAGKVAEAERAYRRAIRLDERNTAALVPLGQLLRQQGQDTEAVSVYRHALDLVASAEQRAYLSGELAALGQLAD